MKTIVLDDDPTGTQCASNVLVLIEWDIDSLTDALRKFNSVYLQTNSRALNESDAVEQAIRIRTQCLEAGKRLNHKINFVLRGDSTLRGHVFSETEVFMEPNTSIIFVPAYPEVGRTSIDGIHYIKIEDQIHRVDKTEFANDPVFPFSTSKLVDYVSEKSQRKGIHIKLKLVRADISHLVKVLSEVLPGSVIIPDIENDSDIEKIAAAILVLREKDIPLIVRCAAPLAATLAGVRSKNYLPGPLMYGEFKTLLIAGSHTEASTKQLTEISHKFGKELVINTQDALNNPTNAANLLISMAKKSLLTKGFVAIASERVRKIENNTLEDGEKIMKAIISVVAKLIENLDVVVAKGGITSAEVARIGIGSKSAWVLGQILPGISVWKLKSRDDKALTYVVVPGNIGDPKTLVKVLQIVGLN